MIVKNRASNRDYFMVGEFERFLFTSCEDNTQAKYQNKIK